MSVRGLFLSALALAPPMLLSASASAQGLYLPLPLPDDTAPRPSYRQRMNEFPPPGGRMGGGILEYLGTGGRPVPVAPQFADTVLPNIVNQPYARPGDRRADYGGIAAGPARTFPGPAVAPGPVIDPVVGPLERPEPRRRARLRRGRLPSYTVGEAMLPSDPALARLSRYVGQASMPVRQVDFSQPNDFSGLTNLFGYAPAAPAAPAAAVRVAPAMNPAYARQVVDYAGRERPGTIVIDTPDKFLYLVEGGGRAIRYGIGVGRPGFTWSGVKSISRKAEWPGWTPPPQMLRRRPDLPRHMVGGEANPLGARAMYLGSSMYRIHGTSEPETIGTNVSSGCIRMTNADVSDLYERVGVGTRVVVR